MIRRATTMNEWKKKARKVKKRKEKESKGSAVRKEQKTRNGCCNYGFSGIRLQVVAVTAATVAHVVMYVWAGVGRPLIPHCAYTNEQASR